jgi:cytoskeletal protein RodZ
MEKLGSYLKKEREAKNCSLEEISSATKIRKGILSAIENDDYTLLPPPVFVKGFLKAYATHLGLDYSELVKKYKEVDTRYQEEEEGIGEEKQKRPLLKTLAFPLAAGIIILAAIFYFISTQPSSISKKDKVVSLPPVNVIPEKKSEEIQEETPALQDKGSQEQELPADSSLKESEIAVAEGSEVKKLNLEFKAKAETWIGFKLDDEKSSQILLQAGETLLLKADRIIRLKVGNAGGVDLFLNNELLPSQGVSGEVVRLTLTEEGLARQVNDEQLY